MAVLPASAGREGDAPASFSRPAAPTPDVPIRADGVELIGEMVGSGYREPPALARRGDGQTFQLTPLLYLVLSTVDGRRGYDEVAQRVGAAYGDGPSRQATPRANRGANLSGPSPYADAPAGAGAAFGVAAGGAR